MPVTSEVNTSASERLGVPRGKPIPAPAVTIGERIRDRQKLGRVPNEALAEAAGVHVKTVSQWRSDRQAPTRDNLKAIAPILGTTVDWLRDGDGPSIPQLREVYRAWGAPEAGTYGVSRGLPKAVQLFMFDFLKELAEADVSEREIEEARRSLTSPENYTFYVGGNPVEYSEEEVLMGVQAFALAIRGILRDRGYKKLKAK